MIKNFGDIAFTDTVKEVQSEFGSRRNYERMAGMEMNQLFQREKALIETRDSFYMATVSENGWPYVQFRGGPQGFVKVLNPSLIGFADFRGNMQYLSTGNMLSTKRVALIFLDYPTRTRIKVWAETEIVSADHEEWREKLIMPEYEAKVERFMLFHVKAFDWNCPQHITPRFTQEEFESMLRSGQLQLNDELLKQLQNTPS